MGSEPEEITFKFVSPAPSFPLTSYGKTSCSELGDGGSDSTCTVELFDWEGAIDTMLKNWAPQAISKGFGGLNGVCRNDSNSNECQNWNKINKQVLPSYCQRIGYFTVGPMQGDCRNYNVNPFNPVYPQSKGCSKMTSVDSVCSKWIMANRGSEEQFPGVANDTMVKYCANQLTTDCACMRADDSVIFNEVSVQGVGTTTCWWEPCQENIQGGYLIEKTAIPGVCPGEICVNVSNIFLDNTEIGKSLIVKQVNACGNPIPPKSPWYEQWWFWIIVFALVIILFAILIYYTSML